MYDVHKIQNMKHELTSLAYEMNGAPLRLRCENELDFKMVKWVEAIESCTILFTYGQTRAGITKIMIFMDAAWPI